ncbi:GTPase activator protein, partial [Oryctes borbonicus]
DGVTDKVPEDELAQVEIFQEVENGLKPEEEDTTKSNGHIHYYTPFDVERKDLQKVDSTSSTKAQCSSIDTLYSSKDAEILNMSREVPSLEKVGSQGNDVEEPISEEFEPIIGEMKDFVHNVIVTNASVDLPCPTGETSFNRSNLDALAEENNSLDTLDCIESHGLASPAMSACVSPASSNGGIYTPELLETFGLNLHRIEKDVQRCDRNYWYFTGENLEKLRNVMCTYVWEHLDVGYMQGMCDLVAPLLVVFNDESLTYACFCHLMERMVENFPNGNAMDCHFANMRSLIQILDSEMYELMHSHGDYTHFYFCYRWFLLDFKRELVYPDVYATWEVIWAARHVSSTHFVLFLALALLETYRDIILSNSMDFTDIIKFFNEMAERHNASAVLGLARDLVLQLQLLIENK